MTEFVVLLVLCVLNTCSIISLDKKQRKEINNIREKNWRLHIEFVNEINSLRKHCERLEKEKEVIRWH
jgi:maltose-binding protein MalE